uniref:UvrABC system protein A n=1 Tax=Thermosporothrix sp. COM3 TaxID=2490863 RepID=A0A455SMK1_9CHLR|nr:UvrABC system protein A [Thermosporothrix sp. COM3]
MTQSSQLSENLLSLLLEQETPRRTVKPVVQQKATLEADKIVVRGARQHNLRNIDVSIPRYKLVVMTGVSGSGKSSLAFDTIYAEGERRYMDNLSPFIRSFLDQVEKPHVDYIGGLSPTIAIEQKTVSKNPRSTVGTITEVINYLRLLYSRIGIAHCLNCGTAIHRYSPADIVSRISRLPAGTSIQLYTPDLLHPGQLIPKTYITRIELPANQDQHWKEELFTLVKRALKAGNGSLLLATEQGEKLIFSEQRICPRCGTHFPELASYQFNPNKPGGMCNDCNGMGTRLFVDPELLIDPTLSILDGAIKWFGSLRKRSHTFWPLGNLDDIAAYYQIDLETPWQELPQHFRDALLYGSEDKIPMQMEYDGSNGHWSFEKEAKLIGLVQQLYRLYHNTTSETSRKRYATFMSQQICQTCQGTCLTAEARAVTLGGKNIHEISNMAIEHVYAWLTELEETLDNEAWGIAAEALHEAQRRLRFMLKVGLNYLTLNRAAPTLSGGEGQRIRLASQLGDGLVGVLYVLDEPSIGLHARDLHTLLETLIDLRDMGNTVLVVEHDELTMRSADWIIDIGPGAGVRGGELVYAGPPAQITEAPRSITGQYLSGKRKVELPRGKQRRSPQRGWLSIKGATLHNLKGVDVSFPLGLLTCITGVSGSGKSSLINGTLYPALMQAIHHTTPEQCGPYRSLEGVEQLNKVINITQDPIGRTPRSNPATYVGIFDTIRQLFAKTEAARAKGYTAEHFSFNVEGGRCEHCKGHGQIFIEMHFLPNVWVTCKDCNGSRYTEDILAIRYKGKNIADVLNMNIGEALAFFNDNPKLARMLQTLCDVGLDYITLGQSATTFSGGEAQRIKLAKELSRMATGKTLYILDEPTTGLHFADTQHLLNVLHRLVDAGNTVLVIEHELDVLKTADWIIDMGPDGGEQGGYLVAEGTPEQIADNPKSITGRYLRAIL